MRVLLLTAIKNLPNVEQSLRRTKELLTKQGHTVNADVLEEQLEAIPLNEEKNIVALHQKLEKELKNTDIIIAELSGPSSGIGYMVAKALSYKKPVLILYHKDKASAHPPIPIRGEKSRLLFFKEYDADQLESIIEDFISKARKQLDSKFILIIPPDIDHYLEWAAEHRRLHKAQIVRESIEDKMKRNKEYRQYIESITL